MILLALGSNLKGKFGTPAETVCRAISMLGQRGVTVTRQSRLWLTPAWPDPTDPPFVNVVIAVETELSPFDLADVMFSIEDEAGRQRHASNQNAPRSLDIDLIAYNSLVLEGGEQRLSIPHPRMSARAFVLVPLSDIASDWVHPVNSKTVQDMIALLSPEDVEAVSALYTPEFPLKADPSVMGILNVTPDSFSDGGIYFDPEKAVAHALKMIKAGANIIDIGGESTRPGAVEVNVDEEISRIVPVIKALRENAGAKGIRISVDTRKAAVMRAAINAGADMVNDVTALTHDPECLRVAREADVPICLMHMQGTPETMQDRPEYNDVVDDVYQYLNARIQACLTSGILPKNLIVDPGIGFGKTVNQNCQLIASLNRFCRLGAPVLIGASRKSMIGQICENTPPEERLAGTIAINTVAYNNGASIFRVHDVAETVQALAVAQRIKLSAYL